MATPIELDDPWQLRAPERDGRRLSVRVRVAVAVAFGAIAPLVELYDGAGAWDTAEVLLPAGGGLILALAGVIAIARTTTSASVWGPVVAATTALALAFPPTIGRQPIVVTVVMTFLAAAVLTPPPSAAPERRSLAPLGPLVGAAVVWARTASAPLTALALAVALGMLVLPSVSPGAARRLDAAVVTAVRRIGEAASVVLVLVLALPTLYLGGAVARAVESARRRRGAPDTAWQEVADASPQERAARMFVAPARAGSPVRRALVAGSILAIVAILIGTLVWVDRRDGDATVVVVDRRDVSYADIAAFDDEPWAADLQREQAQVQPDTQGAYVNVVGGERRTLAPPACTCPRAEVWLIGGSTAFGIGQRDSHTVASELVRLGADDGIALDVRNLAFPGWLASEAVASAASRMAEDQDPDVVVHLGGFNDTLLMASTLASGEDPARATSLDAGRVLAYLEAGASIPGPDGPERAGREAAVRLRASDVRLGDVSPTDVLVRSYFQPDALAAPVQQRYLPPETRDLASDDLQQALETAVDELDGRWVDLRALIAPVDEPVFSDLVHTNEAGARLVAEAIYSDLRAELRARAEAE